MSTEQNYAGKGSHATPSEQAVNSDQHDAPLGELEELESKYQVGAAALNQSYFGTVAFDPKFVNNLRQDVRAWYASFLLSQYVAEADVDHHGPNNMAQSIKSHEILDAFLSRLVELGIDEVLSKMPAK